MTLKEALISRGESEESAETIIIDMAHEVYDGANPEEVLLDEGLEADYVMDLLEYCM